MKLAEILNHRADLQKRMKDLKQRISKNLLVQDGECPTEKPMDLMKTFTELADQWVKVVRVINTVNNQTTNTMGDTLSELIVKRDYLKMMYNMAVDAHSGLTPRMDRFSRSEIKQVPTMDADVIRKDCDSYAKQLRELDNHIQVLNWSVDVPEKLLTAIEI